MLSAGHGWGISSGHGQAATWGWGFSKIALACVGVQPMRMCASGRAQHMARVQGRSRRAVVVAGRTEG